MKRVFLVSLFLTGIFFNAFSQKDTTDKQKMTIAPTIYYVSTQYVDGDVRNVSYEQLNSNSTLEMVLGMNIPLNEKMEIKTGVGLNYKYGNAYLKNIEDVRIKETFARIPLTFNYNMQLNKKKNISYYLGLGSYLDVLTSQQFYFKDESTKPNEFKDSYSFGSYLKSGITMHFGFKFPINKKIFIDFGFKLDGDYKSLFINPNDNPEFDYSTFGIYLSMGSY